MQQGRILREKVPADAMAVTHKGSTEIILMNKMSLLLKYPEARYGTASFSQIDPHYYCSIASNSEYVAIQTDRGFELFDADQRSVVWKKEKDEQLKSKTCCSEIGLLKNNKMIVHSICAAKNKLAYSISLYHSLTSTPNLIETLFAQEFDKRVDLTIDDTTDVAYETSEEISDDEQELRPYLNSIPLLACHPHGTEVAFKIFNNCLTLLSHTPRRMASVMHLLSPESNKDKEEREFNVFPQDVKELIKMYLASLYAFTVEHISIKEVANKLYGNDSYHLLEYSPDGNSIVFLYADRFGMYDICKRHVRYCARKNSLPIASSEDAAIQYRSVAFHPSGTLCALLMTDESILYWDIQNDRYISHIVPVLAVNNPKLSFGKKIAFSQDGTKLFAITKTWKKQEGDGGTKYVTSVNSLVSYDV